MAGGRSDSDHHPDRAVHPRLIQILDKGTNMAIAKKTNSDAISLLKADHRKVDVLFQRYEKSKAKSVKAKLAHEICLELSVHTTIEEELFYPAIKGTIEKDLNDEAYVEHDGAKSLIAEILAGTPDDDFYDAKVKVLSEQIKHHVKEEEQRGGMFAQAKDDGDVDLISLGAAMLARKKVLVAQMKSAGVPRPATRSMNGPPLAHSHPVA
jgi:hemerythrin superfamily protein